MVKSCRPWEKCRWRSASVRDETQHALTFTLFVDDSLRVLCGWLRGGDALVNSSVCIAASSCCNSSCEPLGDPKLFFSFKCSSVHYSLFSFCFSARESHSWTLAGDQRPERKLKPGVRAHRTVKFNVRGRYEGVLRKTKDL